MGLHTKQTDARTIAVFDERGKPIGKVDSPNDRQLFGPTRETVYLDRRIVTGAAPRRAA